MVVYRRGGPEDGSRRAAVDGDRDPCGPQRDGVQARDRGLYPVHRTTCGDECGPIR